MIKWIRRITRKIFSREEGTAIVALEANDVIEQMLEEILRGKHRPTSEGVPTRYNSLIAEVLNNAGCFIPFDTEAEQWTAPLVAYWLTQEFDIVLPKRTQKTSPPPWHDLIELRKL